MPLKPGKDKATISQNIATEIRNGKRPDVAAAIAYSVAGESKRPKTKQPTGKRGKSTR